MEDAEAANGTRSIGMKYGKLARATLTAEEGRAIREISPAVLHPIRPSW